MIARSTTTSAVGIALAAHGSATLLTRPLPERARRMAARGFAPGLPHAVLVPLLEVAAGSFLGRPGVVGTLAAAGAAALGAVRVGTDLDDRRVTVGTAAAAGLALVGTAAVRRGRSHTVLSAAVGVIVGFEVLRRRRVLRDH
jgi:hypothetical protein